MPAYGNGIQVVIDPQVWFKLKRDLDAFDPALTKALRSRIKNAGEVAAAKVRETLGKGSFDTGVVGDGLQALINATKVSVSFGAKAAGTKIVTGSGQLSAANKGLLNVYNKASFRHPLFGDKKEWIVQQGRPYFGSVIQASMNQHLLDEIRAAIDDATQAIGAH